MFQNCKMIEYLDLSNFNTNNVSDMGCMFKDCQKLKEIKGINNFNIKNGTNTTDIFAGCHELLYLTILSKFNTTNMIAINFTSISQNINFPMPCKITDNFRDLEEKLYQDYPELKNKDIYFLVNGNLINRNETLEKNKIRDKDAILIYENEQNN